MTSRSYYFTQIKFNCESDGAARIGRCAHRRSQKTSRCSIARDAIHLRQPGDTATKIHTSPKKGVRSLMSCLTTKAKNFCFIYTYIFCFSFKNLKRAYINQILIRFAGHHVLIQLIHARLPGLCLFCFFFLFLEIGNASAVRRQAAELLCASLLFCSSGFLVVAAR